MGIVKERRRFTDVMDEEVEAQREARLEAWGRDDFSTYKPAKLAEGESEVQITKTREVVDGVTPFFREKPMDLALTEGEPLRISCLVASEPRAAMQWLKNDLIFMDDSRLKVVNTEDGWSHLTLDPAMPSDAGLYRVVARNPLGQTSCSVRVVLGDISGPPDSPSIEAMTDTDILLSWQTPAQLNHSASSATRSRWATLILTLTGLTSLTTSSTSTLWSTTSVPATDTSSVFLLRTSSAGPSHPSHQAS